MLLRDTVLRTIIWQQFRWLTYNGECQPTPVSVNTSMPQGDAISPLTLLAVMTGVTRSVLAQEVVSFPLVTYLDDRNMIAETPEQTFRLWCTWQHVTLLRMLLGEDVAAQDPAADDAGVGLLCDTLLRTLLV